MTTEIEAKAKAIKAVEERLTPGGRRPASWAEDIVRVLLNSGYVTLNVSVPTLDDATLAKLGSSAEYLLRMDTGMPTHTAIFLRDIVAMAGGDRQTRATRLMNWQQKHLDRANAKYEATAAALTEMYNWVTKFIPPEKIDPSDVTKCEEIMDAARIKLRELNDE